MMTSRKLSASLITFFEANNHRTASSGAVFFVDRISGAGYVLVIETGDMKMNTEQKILAHLDPTKRMGLRGHLMPANRITCADGFSVSVQAGYANYCSPRDNVGDWNKFELGFPSEADDLIQEYAEEPNNPTETVYGYVPMSVVVALLEKHGGF